MTDNELVKLARKAMASSYSPYSKFKVGAALLASSGKVYSACNVENASLGLSVCAERVAIFSAVSQGERKFRSIAIANATGSPVSPCGACRQVMKEFSNDMKVILAGSTGKMKKYTMRGLLPHAFESGKLAIGKKTGGKRGSR